MLSRRVWCGLKRYFFVGCAIITDTDFSVYDNLILLTVNMYRSCDQNKLPVHNIVWYVLHIINNIYFVLHECEVFIGMLFLFFFVQVFIVLLSLFMLYYFVNFAFSSSVVWMLFIKRTELTLLSVYLEVKEFTSLTSERQHHLTGEVEARFHFHFYVCVYIHTHTHTHTRIVLNENKTETKHWKCWSIFYTPCKNVFLMLIIELCLICWMLCCITNSLLCNKIAVTY